MYHRYLQYSKRKRKKKSARPNTRTTRRSASNVLQAGPLSGELGAPDELSQSRKDENSSLLATSTGHLIANLSRLALAIQLELDLHDADCAVLCVLQGVLGPWSICGELAPRRG